MKHTKWERIETLSGDIYPELIRGLLEANNIPVILSQEGAGKSAYHVSVGPLSEVEIIVPSELSDQARELIDAFFAGKLEDRSVCDYPNNEEIEPPDQG